MKKRITMSVFGVFLCAVSVAFFKYAAFGMDAFQVFVNGMVEVIPISYGTLYVIINAALPLEDVAKQALKAIRERLKK